MALLLRRMVATMEAVEGRALREARAFASGLGPGWELGFELDASSGWAAAAAAAAAAAGTGGWAGGPSFGLPAALEAFAFAFGASFFVFDAFEASPGGSDFGLVVALLAVDGLRTSGLDSMPLLLCDLESTLAVAFSDLSVLSFAAPLLFALAPVAGFTSEPALAFPDAFALADVFVQAGFVSSLLFEAFVSLSLDAPGREGSFGRNSAQLQLLSSRTKRTISSGSLSWFGQIGSSTDLSSSSSSSSSSSTS
mmetsp:Transcript_37719/g.79817  ORF Transcript_37719/g.79817 Transcript_37719/m.79817 type:complete len:252 (-) Transcript_37719:521-1276(-)